jgi:hypothetical protein
MRADGHVGHDIRMSDRPHIPPGPEGDRLRQHYAIRDALAAGRPPPAPIRPPRPPGVGDRVADRLAGWGIREAADCSCKAIRHRMNVLGPDGCEGEIEDLVAAIAGNARAGKFTAGPGIVAPAAAALLGLGVGVEFAARQMIRRAIQECREADGQT